MLIALSGTRLSIDRCTAQGSYTEASLSGVSSTKKAMSREKNAISTITPVSLTGEYGSLVV